MRHAEDKERRTELESRGPRLMYRANARKERPRHIKYRAPEAESRAP